MKRPGKPKWREVFVLTPDEKCAAACVVGAFLLGLATMHYRAKHPRLPPPPSAKEERATKRAVSRPRAPRTTPSPRAATAAAEQDPSGTDEAGDGE